MPIGRFRVGGRLDAHSRQEDRGVGQLATISQLESRRVIQQLAVESSQLAAVTYRASRWKELSRISWVCALCVESCEDAGQGGLES